MRIAVNGMGHVGSIFRNGVAFARMRRPPRFLRYVGVAWIGQGGRTPAPTTPYSSLSALFARYSSVDTEAA
jgi:hypothetical protein